MNKIFVIEDSDDMSNLLYLYLTKEGYEVRVFNHARRALEALIFENPDLILLDVMLPDMIGWDVCRKIRQVTNIPIIFMTGVQETRDIRHGFLLGANDYVVKPFDLKILLNRIYIHLEKRQKDKTLDMIVASPIFGVPLIDVQYHMDIFMLLPFYKDTMEIYQNYITPVVNQLNLSIKYSHDFFNYHSVMRDIWSAIHTTKLIIAECTYKNPNVFYELGIAHTLGKKVIMITQNKEDIPFDLRQYRYIEYDYTPPGVKKLQTELASAISIMLLNE